MKYSKTLFIFIILYLIYLPYTFAQENYLADLKFTIQEDGLVLISGETNYNPLNISQTNEFTTKKGEYWIFEIKTQDVFKNFYYEIYLPKNSEINYIKSENKIRITTIDDRVKIIGYGDNNFIQIMFQYSKKNNIYEKKTSWTYYVITGLIIVCGIIVYKSLKKKNKNQEKTPAEEKLSTYEKDELNERQKQIIEILIKENKEVTQSYLYKKLNIPKSSLARNIKSLERKNIIEKKRYGMTNKIILLKK
ncbi:MAG TPA: winged helix-turn-helix transcriptional regulator [archaeon]|nr:winged helix-turn-helix transcriptional regulator [archaeon]